MLIFEALGPKNNYLLQIHKFVESFSQAAESFLSGEELQYFHQITNEKRRVEYLQSRFALKEWLSQRIFLPPKNIHFHKVGGGKPVLTESSTKLDFNLSHSGEYFALAFSEKGQVGVDIEKIRAPQHLAQIAKKFFSGNETWQIQQELNPQRQVEMFSKFWSGKEALIKTVAGGVFKNIHDVEIDSQSFQIQRLPQDFGSLAQWQLQFFEDIEGYICSVAFKSST